MYYSVAILLLPVDLRRWLCERCRDGGGFYTIIRANELYESLAPLRYSPQLRRHTKPRYSHLQPPRRLVQPLYSLGGLLERIRRLVRCGAQLAQRLTYLLSPLRLGLHPL